jgi:hypothetical protein
MEEGMTERSRKGKKDRRRKGDFRRRCVNPGGKRSGKKEGSGKMEESGKWKKVGSGRDWVDGRQLEVVGNGRWKGRGVVDGSGY